ncbi:transcriptional regulator family: Fungal Specific TF [Penicillium brevicompactum]|uniref:Transcriptional regulator family: Fungal Specific TF n=1 Tax=Penicillium brevicompactum TaxID=5074 RepID=A0A9W9Q907_PENBR|nr:transcriptional regulator family: Fungal Specific TF [Penicillium brevicompactum]
MGEGDRATQSSSGESGPSGSSFSTETVYLSPPARPDPQPGSELQDKIRDFGYSTHGNQNSLSLLRTAELYGGREASLVGPTVTSQPSFQPDADRKYKELVRQLPSKACIDILAQTFFSGINWQYDLLDEVLFQERLEAWGNISYSDLQVSFGRLAQETLVFPALLFQILAHALLFHSPYDETINSLITMSGMTFHDLGAEYSDTGAQLLALLGKNNIKIATVQAGLLRASFLKSSGKVVEAWHTLGTTIRDAQEIGLHTGRIISEQPPVLTGDERYNASLVGHKIWVILHIWDIHMAVVLGRPIATDLQIHRFSHTIEDETRRQNLFSHWQSKTDVPRPFDIIIAGYTVAYQYFKDIHKMEIDGSDSQDYPTVERIHAAINTNIHSLPSWCRLQNPDTRFDQLNGCQWLPAAREGLSSLIHLVVLTLHRPFIFSSANSRIEAVKSGVSILQAQERLFQRSEPHQRKVFNPVYAFFDAIVLILAVCLVFPNEDLETREESIIVVEEGIQRLEIIGQSNSMAKSAHGVVYSLYHRLKLRPSFSETEDTRAFFNNVNWTPLNSNGYNSNGAPPDFSLDVVSPPRPTHDLFFDHISTQIPLMNAPDHLPVDLPTVNFTENWKFEGTFSDASFWDMMNEFEH